MAARTGRPSRLVSTLDVVEFVLWPAVLVGCGRRLTEPEENAGRSPLVKVLDDGVRTSLVDAQNASVVGHLRCRPPPAKPATASRVGRVTRLWPPHWCTALAGTEQTGRLHPQPMREIRFMCLPGLGAGSYEQWQ